MTNPMNNQDFDRLVNSIRDDAPDAQTARAAGDRVRERLGAGQTPDEFCAQFRADFDMYRRGQLAEGRRMLVEDHVHSCVACRREYSGSKNLLLIPARPRAANRRLGWAAA
ncbi:MAG: hypothetical protein ACRD4E_14185, partial [Bryobacteraceae bacterium]